MNIPELESLPAEQRQSVLDEAVRTVNATHGKMSNVPHYVGCASAVVVILPLAVMNKGPLIAVLAGVPAYVLCVLVGILLWRRSMVRELRGRLAHHRRSRRRVTNRWQCTGLALRVPVN